MSTFRGAFAGVCSASAQPSIQSVHMLFEDFRCEDAERYIDRSAAAQKHVAEVLTPGVTTSSTEVQIARNDEFVTSPRPPTPQLSQTRRSTSTHVSQTAIHTSMTSAIPNVFSDSAFHGCSFTFNLISSKK